MHAFLGTGTLGPGACMLGMHCSTAEYCRSWTYYFRYHRCICLASRYRYKKHFNATTICGSTVHVCMACRPRSCRTACMTARGRGWWRGRARAPSSLRSTTPTRASRTAASTSREARTSCWARTAKASSSRAAHSQVWLLWLPPKKGFFGVYFPGQHS